MGKYVLGNSLEGNLLEKIIYHDALQTHHVYSTLKRHGNDRFHVVSTWNTHVVFVVRLPQNVLRTGNITRCFKMFQ